jgi:hypothetical protein
MFVRPAPGPVLQVNTVLCSVANLTSGISTAVRPDITRPSNENPLICLLYAPYNMLSNVYCAHLNAPASLLNKPPLLPPP